MFKLDGRHIVIQIFKLKIAIKVSSLLTFINKIKVKKILKNNCTEKTIFVIGDSHTDIFSNNMYDKKLIIAGSDINTYIWFNSFKNVITYHIGAVTAYNSNKKNSSTKCINKIKFLIKEGLLPKNCNCICVFGEIDCRVHIQKQAEKNKTSIEYNIDKVIENYAQFLSYLESNGINIIVYGPIPSQSDKINVDKNFPRYGTQKERNNITKIFNNKLEKLCLKRNYKFITLFDKLINDDMSTKEEFLNPIDNVHLGLNASEMLRESYKKAENKFLQY